MCTYVQLIREAAILIERGRMPAWAPAVPLPARTSGAMTAPARATTRPCPRWQAVPRRNSSRAALQQENRADEREIS